MSATIESLRARLLQSERRFISSAPPDVLFVLNGILDILEARTQVPRSEPEPPKPVESPQGKKGRKHGNR